MDLFTGALAAGLLATVPLPVPGARLPEAGLLQRPASVGAVFLPQASWRAAFSRRAVRRA
jgi:hypothetical protein